jgi:hypothetical protein
MVSNLTRGGLQPAKIYNLLHPRDPNSTVDFMFNPYEFTITKSIEWSDKGKAGVDEPSAEFTKGKARTLSLTLHFDTQEEETDVTKLTQKLWKMVEIDESTRNRSSDKGRPPSVAFAWGSQYFEAVITQISEKFTLFHFDGTPLRSEVNISLLHYSDEDSKKNKSAVASTATSVPAGSTITYTVDMRIDLLAEMGGTGHRTLMGKNGINSLRQLRTGMSLVMM